MEVAFRRLLDSVGFSLWAAMAASMLTKELRDLPLKIEVGSRRVLDRWYTGENQCARAGSFNGRY